jgi:hypothetical protein
MGDPHFHALRGCGQLSGNSGFCMAMPAAGIPCAVIRKGFNEKPAKRDGKIPEKAKIFRWRAHELKIS